MESSASVSLNNQHKPLTPFFILALFFTAALLWPAQIKANTVSFDPENITFTPSMAKRSAPGPFAAAPIIQGEGNDADTLTDDILSFPRGNNIAGNFYQQLDPSQGSIVMWWTPEYSYTDLDGTGDHYLYYFGSNYFLRYEYDVHRFYLDMGGQTLTVSHSPSEGTTYNLIIRWDTVNPVSGSNYICLTIDDTHSCGATTQPTSSAPPNTLYIGTDGNQLANSGLIEGFTIYRRVLSDGSDGIDIGLGDEINQIYNSGSGSDPTNITSSWDIPFMLPTDSSTGALSTGTGEAWSHPHSGNNLTNGLMLNGTAWTNWTQIGTPSATGNTPSNQSILNSGYYFTSSAANEGFYQDVSVTAGQDYVIRALVHGDANCSPQLELYDQTNTASIATINGTTGSTRTAPDQLITTVEIPSGSTTLRTRLLNTASSGTCYWHSVELLDNLWDDPGIESGTAPTTIGSPTSNTQSSTQAHSGTYSWQITSDAIDEGLRRSPTTTSGNFYSLGGWIYADTAGTVDLDTTNFQDGATALLTSSGNDSWILMQAVGRASAATTDIEFVSNGSQTFYTDDVWFTALNNVSLTITPATEGNSTQSEGFRVDGRDQTTQTLTGLGVNDGNIKFLYYPRHNSSDVLSFAEGSTAYIGEWYADANDTIRLYWSSSNTLTLYTQRNGNIYSNTWDTTGFFNNTTGYYFEIDYTTGTNQMQLIVDSNSKITLSSIADFGTAPTTAYWGSDQSGQNQADGVYTNWDDPSLTFTITAVGANTVNNGITTTTASTATSLPFGKIGANDIRYMAHQLYVSTNSASGYELNMNLLATGTIQGLDPSNFIDPFSASGVTWATPIPWTSPTGTVANVNTGWIGANTTDTRVDGWNPGTQLFGPVSTTPNAVMFSTTTDAGTTATVTYAFEVNVSQPTDTYSGQIVYTLVPTY